MAYPSAALAEVLARPDIWRGDAAAAADTPGVATGHSQLDAELPGGGWPTHGLTELLTERPGIGELSLLMPALARLSAAGGWIALVAPSALPHAPAWRRHGIVGARLLCIDAGRDAAWCYEQLLASHGFAAVLGWLGDGDRAGVLRRLQLAAADASTLAFLWRPAERAEQASPAPLRLVLTPSDHGINVHILKRRGCPAARPLHLSLPRSVGRALACPPSATTSPGSTGVAAYA
jgi:hypothetical protein